MTVGAAPALWTCPRCGRSFANRNQAHACQVITVAEHLEDKSESAINIYREVLRALRRHGEFREHPHKGGIGFISRMTFAGVALRRRWVDLRFLLPAPSHSDRMRKLELYGPTSWVHTLRLHSPEEVDAEVAAWLGESLRRGDQETLDPRAVVEPLTPTQLAIFWTGFRGRCVLDGDQLVVRLPGYVADALDLADEVMARIGGIIYPVSPRSSGSSTVITVDPDTGLGLGDETDVFLTGPR